MSIDDYNSELKKNVLQICATVFAAEIASLFTNTSPFVKFFVVFLVAIIFCVISIIVMQRKKIKNNGTVLGVIDSTYYGLTSAIRLKNTADLVKKLEDFLKSIPKDSYWIDFQGNYFRLYMVFDESQYKTIEKLFKFGEQLLLLKDYKFGIILDWENDAKIQRLGGKNFLIGNTWNRVQHLFSLPLSRNFLISKTIYDVIQKENLFDDYKGEQFAQYENENNGSPMFNIYNPKKKVGIMTSTIAQINIEIRNKNKFLERLIDASEVTIVGITNENIVKTLKIAVRKRINRYGEKWFWDNLTIVFSSNEQLSDIVEAGRTLTERKNKWDDGLRQVINFLYSQGNYDKWECRISKNIIPFTGTKITSIDKMTVKVRIAPIIPGANFQENPFFEISQGNHMYKAIERGFAAIVSNSSLETEWILACSRNLDLMQIVDRKTILKHPHFVYPIVLILLFIRENENNIKLLLHKRTIFNSSSDHGKLSNISGYLIDFDLFPNQPDRDGDYLEARIKGDTNKCLDIFLKSQNATKIMIVEKIWRQAAVRELREETGLYLTDTETERFIPHEDPITITLADNISRNFRIFWLLLTQEEKIQIEEMRPHIEFQSHTLLQLQDEYKKGDNCRFNTLLRYNSPVFEKIFSKVIQHNEQPK